MADDSAAGSCTTMLISTDRDCEMINATPRRSGIPVNITAVIG